MRLRASALVAALAALLLAGCSLPNVAEMNFRVDTRLHFLAPPARSLVRQPITLRWTIRDFTTAPLGSGPANPHRGYFAIFVDHAPIRPGQTMQAVAANDHYCAHSAGCPNTAYLAARQIYTTTRTSYRLPLLASLAGDNQTVQLHTVVIVLMDTTGHRIGESSWQLDVRVRKLGV